VFIFSTLEDVEARTQARIAAAECPCSIRLASLSSGAPDPWRVPCAGDVQSAAVHRQGAGSGVRLKDASAHDVHLPLVWDVLHQLGWFLPTYVRVLAIDATFSSACRPICLLADKGLRFC